VKQDRGLRFFSRHVAIDGDMSQKFVDELQGRKKGRGQSFEGRKKNKTQRGATAEGFTVGKVKRDDHRGGNIWCASERPDWSVKWPQLGEESSQVEYRGKPNPQKAPSPRISNLSRTAFGARKGMRTERAAWLADNPDNTDFAACLQVEGEYEILDIY